MTSIGHKWDRIGPELAVYRIATRGSVDGTAQEASITGRS